MIQSDWGGRPVGHLTTSLSETAMHTCFPVVHPTPALPTLAGRLSLAPRLAPHLPLSCAPTSVVLVGGQSAGRAVLLRQLPATPQDASIHHHTQSRTHTCDRYCAKTCAPLARFVRCAKTNIGHLLSVCVAAFRLRVRVGVLGSAVGVESICGASRNPQTHHSTSVWPDVERFTTLLSRPMSPV